MFKEITVKDINKNAFQMYNKDWALLTAGSKDNFNTMTISWGGFGHIWNKDVVFVYVRPSRYTFEYMEREEYFTLSFFAGKYKNDLGYLGSVSGRDENKLAKTSLTTKFFDDLVGYEEAEYIIICKKAHSVVITRDQFSDRDVEKTYKSNDLHTQYIATIEKIYKNVA